MKSLIVCCDGTWQSQDNKVATNVLKIAQTIATKARDKAGNEIVQALYYDQGIGAVPEYKKTENRDESESAWVNFRADLKDIIIFLFKGILYLTERMFGGLFGLGIDRKIEEAYIFLCLNYDPGDKIYLFGYSRGAYTVRSLAGLINCCGLLQRPNINRTSEAYKIYRLRSARERAAKIAVFRQKYHTEESVPIKFLGCWDTVGALGIPNIIPWLPIDRYFKRNLKFHDQNLSLIIENARHAIAIDENRSALEVTVMKTTADFTGTLKQVCFPGGHGCVGGGSNEIIELPGSCKLKTLDLSKAALTWMAQEAQQLGLELDLTRVSEINTPGELKNIKVKEGLLKAKRDLSEFDDLAHDFHGSIIDLWQNQNYRPENISQAVARELDNS